MGIKKMALEPLERPAMIPFTTPGWGKNESKVRKVTCQVVSTTAGASTWKVCESVKTRKSGDLLRKTSDETPAGW